MKRKYRNKEIHQKLTDAGIPRHKDGNKLGLRKRLKLAQSRVNELKNEMGILN